MDGWWMKKWFLGCFTKTIPDQSSLHRGRVNLALKLLVTEPVTGLQIWETLTNFSSHFESFLGLPVLFLSVTPLDSSYFYSLNTMSWVSSLFAGFTLRALQSVCNAQVQTCFKSGFHSITLNTCHLSLYKQFFLFQFCNTAYTFSVFSGCVLIKRHNYIWSL